MKQAAFILTIREQYLQVFYLINIIRFISA